jgi:prepilin peptidase CpaA
VLCSLLAFAAAVAIIDLRRQRIPNALTVPAAAVALVMNFVLYGAAGAQQSAAGLVLGLGLFLPFYLARGFGAGDVKAMGALGAFLGPKGALLAAGCVLMAGMIAGMAVLMARGGIPALRNLLQRLMVRVVVARATGRGLEAARWQSEAEFQRFPYGLAIAVGTALSLLWS